MDDNQWLKTVRDLAEGFAQNAARHDAEATLPVENLQALNACGLDTALLPAPYGQGVSYRTVGQILTVLAEACPSTATVWLMHVGAAQALVGMSAPGQAAHYAAELAAGKRFANALSEPSSGNMFLMPQQSASPTEGGWTLKGAKRFVSGCEIADYFLVNALIDGVPGFFGLSKDETISFVPIWDTMGMRGTRSQLISFEDTLLPAERRCGMPDPTVASFIAVGLPFLSVGIAQAALQALAEHARSRFLPGAGTTLSNMQWLKFDTAALYVKLRGATLLAGEAMSLADAGDPRATLVGMEAKLAANEIAKEMAALGVKAGGGSGYLNTSPIQRHFRDAQAGALMAYSVEVCSDEIGGQVLNPSS
ncbi:acyl-CoA/acyl-ACP dehydrogenase [Kineosporia rhizophila]|uniref:acyl-CoA dehydrogenase family protein n=1 Tax=Kineosporia TaxID=49184 RepID=UPI000A9C4679|nr:MULTISPECIES: acyl-CoA dehydrogenase family protein [Kineosporia]MCE0538112.1 acyl-CoA/acyl-ACP dehydrogenase [Kineosporia rhizophila]GLY14940.1 butyryl-CoA dehydrogenase [Kineosporia sp. NBRC 101677]